jgi:hypothetical protein
MDPQPTLTELEPFYGADYHVFSDELKSADVIANPIRDRFDGEQLNHAAFIRTCGYPWAV